MLSTANIFIGPANLYVDGRHVGFTRGGLRMRTNKSMWFRPSLVGMGVKEGVNSSEDYFITTVLLESTLQNLKMAWGIDGDISSPDGTPEYQRLDFGGRVTTPKVHSLKFVSPAQQMMAVFYRVTAVDFGEVQVVKNSETFIPVTFRVLLDETKQQGYQAGYILRGKGFDTSELTMRVSVTGKIKRSLPLVCKVKVY